MKFPAKSESLSTRWCSSILKIMVADSVIRNLDLFKQDGQRMKFPAKSSCSQGRWCSDSLKAQVESKLYSDIDELAQDVKILVVSGERRQESAGRAKYNKMEIHRTNATAKAHRLVHRWRRVIDWSETQIWDIIRRHRITPYHCYTAGWNRCSCMMCIFSLPTHWPKSVSCSRSSLPRWKKMNESWGLPCHAGLASVHAAVPAKVPAPGAGL